MILTLPRRMLILTLELTLALAPAGLLAEELPSPEPLGKPATKVYRQVLPDGRVVYSDKLVKGARVAETITVEPPVKGTTSADVFGQPSKPPLRTGRTPAERDGLSSGR